MRGSVSPNSDAPGVDEMKKGLLVQQAAKSRSIGRDARTLDGQTPLHDLCANELTKLFRRAAHRLSARSDQCFANVRQGQNLLNLLILEPKSQNIPTLVISQWQQRMKMAN
jgi:hypothetical protein